MLNYRPVRGIHDAIVVRSIRNTCYQYLTNNPSPIGFLQQVRWYYATYRKLERSSQFRLFLFFDAEIHAVGYGALKRVNDDLLVTECVRYGYRGQGSGTFILRVMMSVAKKEGRTLIAETWADNQASIALHERQGFVLASKQENSGRELRTYVLSDHS